MARNRNTEDRSVLALLYDEYKRTYPETAESIQREIAAVYIGLCDDRARYAYEDGVKAGVRLALDLELDCTMCGGGYVSDH